MATEALAAEGATGYIIHHLTPLSAGEGFWTLHLDTLIFSALLGALFIWFFKSAKRPPGDVVGELNPLFAEGIRKAGNGQRLIAWDWVWNEKWAPDAIGKLPAGASFMSVSEWSLPIERGGVKSAVGEYSISAIGPGPRALRHWKVARERGLKPIAKIQAGNTWELSPVPYIPAVENVARHVENLRGAKVDGLMLSWTLGGCPSPNLEVVAETLKSGSATGAMWQVAKRRFGSILLLRREPSQSVKL